MVVSRLDFDTGIPDCYWVEVTEAGKGFEFSDEQMGIARDLMEDLAKA